MYSSVLINITFRHFKSEELSWNMIYTNLSKARFLIEACTMQIFHCFLSTKDFYKTICVEWCKITSSRITLRLMVLQTLLMDQRMCRPTSHLQTRLFLHSFHPSPYKHMNLRISTYHYKNQFPASFPIAPWKGFHPGPLMLNCWLHNSEFHRITWFY